MGDERRRAHGEHLRQREHGEDHVAGAAYPRDRRVPDPRDEVQVDEVIERLQQHAGRDRHGERDQVAEHGAVGEILHGASASDTTRIGASCATTKPMRS